MSLRHWSIVKVLRASARQYATASSTQAALLESRQATLAADSHTDSMAAIYHTNPIMVSMSSFIPTEDDSVPSNNLAMLDPTVFNQPIRPDILHLCVVNYLDSLRQGSANTKTRGEVRGSGRKLRPQKGSGRARLGDAGSPMLRSGGVAFGPKPRDFSTKLPRKVIQAGMRVALSSCVKANALRVVSSLEWSTIKTKDMLRRMNDLDWNSTTLFVTGRESIPNGLALSAKNLKFVGATLARDLNVYQTVKWSQLVFDLEAVDYFEKSLGKRN